MPRTSLVIAGLTRSGTGSPATPTTTTTITAAGSRNCWIAANRDRQGSRDPPPAGPDQARNARAGLQSAAAGVANLRSGHRRMLRPGGAPHRRGPHGTLQQPGAKGGRDRAGGRGPARHRVAYLAGTARARARGPAGIRSRRVARPDSPPLRASRRAGNGLGDGGSSSRALLAGGGVAVGRDGGGPARDRQSRHGHRPLRVVANWGTRVRHLVTPGNG